MSVLNYFLEESEVDDLIYFSVTFDPRFEKWLYSMYSSLSNDFSAENIDKWGEEVIAYLKKAEELIFEFKKENDFDKKVELAGEILVYKYGYGNALNNAIDYGFIQDLLFEKLQKEAEEKGVSVVEVLQFLDVNSKKSLFLKRASEAEKILRKTNLSKELREAEEIFSKVEYMKIDGELRKLFEKTSNPLLEEYLPLFKEEYFPYFALFKMLVLVNKQGAGEKKQQKFNFTVSSELVEVYSSLKYWKERTSIYLDKLHKAIYYDVFDDLKEEFGLTIDNNVFDYLEKIKEKLKISY